MPNPKSPKQSLKALQKEWYKKLKDDGFTDIENDEDHLKFYNSQFAAQFVERDSYVWEAKAEYYRMAEHFLHEYEFESELEKVIWEYHANALSYRDIAKVLKKLKLVKKTNRTTVYITVNKLKDKMFAMYMPDRKK